MEVGGRLAEDSLAEGRLAEDSLVGGNLVEDNLAEGNLVGDTLVGDTLAEVQVVQQPVRQALQDTPLRLEEAYGSSFSCCLASFLTLHTSRSQ